MNEFTEAVEKMRLDVIRKHIVAAIGYDPITASWTDETGAHSVVTYMAAKDRDRIVEAILPLIAQPNHRVIVNLIMPDPDLILGKTITFDPTQEHSLRDALRLASFPTETVVTEEQQ